MKYQKITLYGSPHCPGCVEACAKLKELGLDYEYVIITNSMANLKAFLAYRDTLPLFEEVRQVHRVGIPFMVLEKDTGEEEKMFAEDFFHGLES